jgi:stage II sporulation protein D
MRAHANATPRCPRALKSIGTLIGVVTTLLILWPPTPALSESPLIRVGVRREVERIIVMSDRPIALSAGTAFRVRIDPGAYEFTPTPTGVAAAGVGSFDATVRLVPADGARLYLDIHPYRGIVELRRTGAGRLTVINEVDLEEYLYGVLKNEVDPQWPTEALKAQAVASRTWALYNFSRFASEGYDVCATTECQVYSGVTAEDPRTSAAVDETRGQIMTYQGRPIFAAYHSDSGGYTESSDLVWGGAGYPYLKGVADPYSIGAPRHEWIVRMDLSTFESRVRGSGRLITNVMGIEVAEATPSGRAALLRIFGAHGVLIVKGAELRAVLGADLRSTLFTVRLVPDDPPHVEFRGRGSGHGVGLSQWGARGMAEMGWKYQEILGYYYSGIAFETK